jgi:hypothetical protein
LYASINKHIAAKEQERFVEQNARYIGEENAKKLGKIEGEKQSGVIVTNLLMLYSVVPLVTLPSQNGVPFVYQKKQFDHIKLGVKGLTHLATDPLAHAHDHPQLPCILANMIGAQDAGKIAEEVLRIAKNPGLITEKAKQIILQVDAHLENLHGEDLRELLGEHSIEKALENLNNGVAIGIIQGALATLDKEKDPKKPENIEARMVLEAVIWEIEGDTKLIESQLSTARAREERQFQDDIIGFEGMLDQLEQMANIQVTTSKEFVRLQFMQEAETMGRERIAAEIKNLEEEITIAEKALAHPESDASLKAMIKELRELRQQQVETIKPAITSLLPNPRQVIAALREIGKRDKKQCIDLLIKFEERLMNLKTKFPQIESEQYFDTLTSALTEKLSPKEKDEFIQVILKALKFGDTSKIKENQNPLIRGLLNKLSIFE